MASDDAMTALRERLDEAVAERDRLRALFDRMGQGYCELELLRDADGAVIDFRYLEFNAAFERLFAIPVAAARGRTASEIFPGLDRWWHDAYDRIATAGRPERLEHQVSMLGRWFEVFAYPDTRDRLTLLYEDITDRRVAEDALRESRERLALAIEVGGLASWDWNVRTGAVTWNDRHFVLQGYGVGEVAPSFDAWLARVHPDDRLATVARIERARDTHEVYSHVFRTCLPDGTIRWCSARGQFFYDEDGEPVRMIGVMEDISARRQAEDTLKQREVDLARVQRIGRVGGLDIDIAGGLVSYRSPEYLRLHGLPSDGRIETHAQWRARVHPDDRERAERTLFDTLGGTAMTYDSEYRIVRPSDGAVRWIHARADIERDAAGTATRLVGAHLDVTDQKRMHDVLRASEERQGFLLKLSDALRPLSDPVAIEDAACRILGEYLGVDWVQYGELDLKRGTITNMRDFFRADAPSRAGLPSHVGTYDLARYQAHARAWTAGRSVAIADVAADGSLGEEERAGLLTYAVAAALTVPLMKEGRPSAIMAALHGSPRAWTPSEIALVEDTVDRTWAAVLGARAEHALRESETRFRQFAAASSAGLWIRSAPDLRMEYASPAVAAIYGLDVETVLDDVERWLDRVVPEDRAIATGHLDRARQGQPSAIEFRIHRGGDDAVRWLRSTCFALRNGDAIVRRIGGTVEDITDKKIAHDRQATLLAELQHRVRNILAVTRSIVARTYDEDRSASDYVQHLDGRIAALARTQVLLTRRVGAGVDLEEMVADELLAQAALAEQFTLAGPDILLSPKAAETLGLAVHELATNSVKYGALSRAGAQLAISWRLDRRDDAEWLALEWRETGVPIVQAAPPRTGFGCELITRRIPYELRGHGALDFRPGGVVAHIAFPLIGGDSILSSDGGSHD